MLILYYSKTDMLGKVWQRIPVALSCLCFILLLGSDDGSPVVPILFAVVALLACLEKLAAVANTVAVERDWVCLSLRSPGTVTEAISTNLGQVIVISESLDIPRQGKLQ